MREDSVPAPAAEWIALPKGWNILLPMRRPETLHRPAERLMAREFVRGSGYAGRRPRGSGDWLLIYTQAGAGNIMLESGPRRLPPGSAVLFAPGAAQDYSTDPTVGRWRLRWAHFHPRPNWRAWMRWTEASPGVGWITLPEGELRDGFERSLARAIVRLRRPDGLEFAMNALEEAFLWARGAVGPEARLDERIRRALGYLAEHSGEPFRLADVAVHCGLSLSRLSHLFKEQLGQTPQRYGEELRMRLAQQLLAHSDLPVAEIAAETGFADAFYFAKRFRKFAGCSPTEYRAKPGPREI